MKKIKWKRKFIYQKNLEIDENNKKKFILFKRRLHDTKFRLNNHIINRSSKNTNNSNSISSTLIKWIELIIWNIHILTQWNKIRK